MAPGPRERIQGSSQRVIGGAGLGKGRGKGGLGKGIGIARLKRHSRVHRDAIHGISKGDIRRLARRGGVKRISAAIYDQARGAMVDFMKEILHDCSIYLEHSNRKTITVTDVVFSLKRRGRMIYGFDKEFPIKEKRRRARLNVR